MNFTHLHVHTEYSLLDGSNKIQEYYGLEERYVEIEIAGGEGPVDLSPDSGRDSLYSGISGGQ